MTDDIERLIRVTAPGDAAWLDGVEDAVWARIGARRNRTQIHRVRVAAVALALVVGVTNGGLTLLGSPTPQPSELHIFTVSAGLSPLASLDVQG